MWDLMVSVPDHCLSFYFTQEAEGHKKNKDIGNYKRIKAKF